MAVPLSPHSRFMSWVHDLRGPSPPAAGEVDSEAEEDEVIKLLLPDRFTPSRSPSQEPQYYPDLACSQASSSAVQLPFSRPGQSSSRASADVKGKEKATELDLSSSDSKRKRSEEPDDVDAGGSAPKKQRPRRIPGRSTSKRARESPRNTATEDNQALPATTAPLIDIEEFAFYAGEGDGFHSSDSEPGSYLANGRRRRRDLERARRRDTTPPTCPLPFSTICVEPEGTEAHAMRPQLASWMYRTVCESSGSARPEGAPVEPPKFPRRKPAPKRSAFSKPRTWLASSAPISDAISATSTVKSTA